MVSWYFIHFHGPASSFRENSCIKTLPKGFLVQKFQNAYISFPSKTGRMKLTWKNLDWKVVMASWLQQRPFAIQLVHTTHGVFNSKHMRGWRFFSDKLWNLSNGFKHDVIRGYPCPWLHARPVWPGCFHPMGFPMQPGDTPRHDCEAEVGASSKCWCVFWAMPMHSYETWNMELLWLLDNFWQMAARERRYEMFFVKSNQTQTHKCHTVETSSLPGQNFGCLAKGNSLIGQPERVHPNTKWSSHKRDRFLT